MADSDLFHATKNSQRLGIKSSRARGVGAIFSAILGVGRSFKLYYARLLGIGIFRLKILPHK